MKYKIKPWDHQLEAIERALPRKYFGLFFEMGAGKTATAINILRHKYALHQGLLRTLVLCPPIVIDNWVREFRMHSNVGQVTALNGTGAKRLKTFNANSENPHVFITNYESLLMKDLFTALKDWGPTCIVFDESHKLKNMKSKRTKLAIQLGDLADYKYLLTGTPVLNNAMDLFAQFRAMDGGETFGKNFYFFRARFFHDKNAAMPSSKYFPSWEPNPDTYEVLNECIKRSSVVIKKEECLDLPDLVKKEILIELAPKQRKLYESMARDLIVYMNEKACVASMALTKALRLMQIASGFITVEGDTERENIPIKNNPRAMALKELLESLVHDHKVIVWAVFKENYRAIVEVCDAIGVNHVEVNGSVGAKTKQERIDAFNTDDTIRVFIGHPGSAGIGVNLVVASYSIFYSRNFSLENDKQAEARNHRGGSEIHEKITRIDLIAKNTIDEQIALRLAAKEKIGASVLNNIINELV